MAGMMSYLRHSLRDEHGNLARPLEVMLNFAHSMRCTDPRDRIYALANLSSDWKDLGIPVSYTASLESIFTTVTARILQSPQHSFLVLNAVEWDKNLDLPSWVPDWSRIPTHSKLALEDGNSGFVHAAGGSSRAHVSVNEDAGILTIDVAMLGPVNTVTNPFTEDHLEQPDVYDFLLEQCEQVWGPGHPYFNGQDMKKALWLTLIGGYTDILSHPATVDNFGAHFEAWKDASSPDCELPRDYARLDMVARFYRALLHKAYGQRWCIVGVLYMGLVPGATRAGDLICIIPGARTPFVLRAAAESFRLVGECYVHGVMHGEFLNSKHTGFERIKRIDLIQYSKTSDVHAANHTQLEPPMPIPCIRGRLNDRYTFA